MSLDSNITTEAALAHSIPRRRYSAKSCPGCGDIPSTRPLQPKTTTTTAQGINGRFLPCRLEYPPPAESGTRHDDAVHAAAHHDDDDSSSFSSAPAADPTELEGTWGERDAGLASRRAAMGEFEELRRELTELSKKQSRRSLSRATGPRVPRRAVSRTTLGDEASQAGDLDLVDEKDEAGFELDDFIREGHFEKRTDGRSAKKVGVVFKHLTVEGAAHEARFVKTLPDAILGTFGPDLYHLAASFLPFLRFTNGPRRTILHDVSGVVRDGQMMLVLGRPGAGCSTFLQAIANNRDAFAAVHGDVSYGGIPADQQKKHYRGEVTYNPEDDVHFANLTVWQTFTFALATKTKKAAAESIPIVAEALMKMFGISHTRDTLVGDEYTRGVSGGERKRVSIAETLASKSTVVCWDNSTRGLDASTALDYAKSLRIMTDVSNRTTLVTLYQASESIVELMDKILVLDAGRCIYQGPANEARQYFVDLGFEAAPRQTTADFLTAVTDPNERRFRDGCEPSAPKTPQELEAAYRASRFYTLVQQDIQTFEANIQETEHRDAREFEAAVQEGKSGTVHKKSPYTVSFVRQVQASVRRELWLLFGDKTTLYTKVFV